MNNNNMADIFEDEHAKKKSREQRKKEKNKKHEDEITKNYKNLMDDEVIFKKIDDSDFKKKKKEVKIDEEEKQSSVIDFLYDTLFGFVTILLFITSLGYLGYTYFKNPGFNNFVVAGLLVATGLFYMLSMFSRNKHLKRTFSILCSLALMGFMAVELFLI